MTTSNRAKSRILDAVHETASDLERLGFIEPIRKNQDRQHLRGLLLEGAESATAASADVAYFNTLRNRVQREPDEAE